MMACELTKLYTRPEIIVQVDRSYLTEFQNSLIKLLMVLQREESMIDPIKENGACILSQNFSGLILTIQSHLYQVPKSSMPKNLETNQERVTQPTLTAQTELALLSKKGVETTEPQQDQGYSVETSEYRSRPHENQVHKNTRIFSASGQGSQTKRVSAIPALLGKSRLRQQKVKEINLKSAFTSISGAEFSLNSTEEQVSLHRINNRQNFAKDCREKTEEINDLINSTGSSSQQLPRSKKYNRIDKPSEH